MNRLACLKVGLLKRKWGHTMVIWLRLKACLMIILILLTIRVVRRRFRGIRIVNFWASIKVFVTKSHWI